MTTYLFKKIPGLRIDLIVTNQKYFFRYARKFETDLFA